MKFKHLLLFLSLVLINTNCYKDQPENYNAYSVKEELTAEQDQTTDADYAYQALDHTTFLFTLFSQGAMMAYAHPAVHGLTGGDIVETRTGCPCVTVTDTNGGFPKTVKLEFDNCQPAMPQFSSTPIFQHTYDGDLEMVFQDAPNIAAGDFTMELTTPNFSIENEDQTKTFTITMTDKIDFNNGGNNGTLLQMGYQSLGTITITEGNNITTYPPFGDSATTPNISDFRFQIIPDANDDPTNFASYIDNEVRLSIADRIIITCSADGGATETNACISIDIGNNANLKLLPLTCGCPYDGQLVVRPVDGNGDCIVTFSTRTIYDYGYDTNANCTNAEACDNGVARTFPNPDVCLTLTSCGTP